MSRDRDPQSAVFRTILAIATLVAAWLASGPAFAQIAQTPVELQHVGVSEHLEAPLPLDTTFRDHTGKTVKLRDYFDGKRPVVLTFAYHSCPVLCGLILNNEAAALKSVPMKLGDDYQAITISIDPNDPLDKTAAKRASVLHELGVPPTDAAAWHFLLGDAPSIARVAAAAGFEYQYDERQKQWGHPSVVMVLTPDGRMARYLYGIEFAPNDLRLALIEAKAGRSITTVEQIILYCYHYDPQGGKYVLMANRVMQLGGAAIAVVLFGVLGALWAREYKKHKKRKAEALEKPQSPEPEEEQQAHA